MILDRSSLKTLLRHPHNRFPIRLRVPSRVARDTFRQKEIRILRLSGRLGKRGMKETPVLFVATLRLLEMAPASSVRHVDQPLAAANS